MKLQATIKEKELEAKTKDEMVKNALEAQSIQNEFFIEANAIAEDKRANITNEKLKAAELGVQAALQTQKNIIDDKKAKTASKTHVMDTDKGKY